MKRFSYFFHKCQVVKNSIFSDVLIVAHGITLQGELKEKNVSNAIIPLNLNTHQSFLKIVA